MSEPVAASYMADGLPASALVTFNGVPSTGETITVGTDVYTFGLDFFGDNEVMAAKRFAASVNGDGSDAGFSTALQPAGPYRAYHYGKSVRLVAAVPGTAGNGASLATTSTKVALTAFAGGTDSANSLAATNVILTQIELDTTAIEVDTTSIAADVTNILGDTANLDTNVGLIVGHLDGVEGSLTAINADTTGILADTAAIDVNVAAIVGHVDGVEGLLTSVEADTTAILADTAAIDANVAAVVGYVDSIETSIDGVEGLLSTIDASATAILADTAALDVNVGLINGKLPAFATASGTPLGTENALVVRNVPSGTQAVSGIVTANEPQGNTITGGGVASAATALSANANRLEAVVQNLGTNPLYVKFGAGGSTVDFHVILAGGSVNDDGNGALIVKGGYTGVVTVAGTGLRYAAWEVAP